MPFGHDCEFRDFAHCVRVMRGRARDPEAWCAALMRETEERCRRRGLFARLFSRAGSWASLDAVGTDGCKATVETRK